MKTSMTGVITFTDRILEYLRTIDESLEKLSHLDEGKISGLPGWTLCCRDVKVGFSKDGTGMAIRISQNQRLTEDRLSIQTLHKKKDFDKLMAPWKASFPPEQLGGQPFLLMSGAYMVAKDNPLAEPPIDDRALTAFRKTRGAEDAFNVESGKHDAINFWNYARLGKAGSGSYVLEVNAVLEKMQNLSNRRNFLERRIHRFLDEHARLLLPPFRKKYFEHKIYFGDRMRKADFVLEREAGLPPLLIELEAPSHNVFRANEDLTSQANHARAQIAEWVSFIDRDSKRNTSGNFEFLAGPKQRLVVMGKGLQHEASLLNTRFTDTTIWTYDLLLKQAKERLSADFAHQCKTIGAQEIQPFK